MRIQTFSFTVFLLLPGVAAGQAFGGIGARAEGMGGAFVAVADDATAVYWNPAGIATGATFDFQLSFAKLNGGLTPVRGSDPIEPASSVFIGAVLPVLGLSFYRTHTVQPDPDRQNEGSGQVQIRTLTTSNVGVTVVQTVVYGLVIGTTARLVRGGVDSFDTRTTVDLDAGALVSVGGLRLGITGRNLRKPTFETAGGPMPLNRQVRAGVALAPRSLPTGVHGPFSVAFDTDLVRTPGVAGDSRMAAVGGEYWLAAGRIGARAGFRWNTVDNPYRALSLGATVKLPRSVFVEGQLTKPSQGEDALWNVGARITF